MRLVTTLGIKITWLEGGIPRSRLVISSPLNIGQASEAEIAFPNDGMLSRLHARIEPDGKGWRVVDLDSTNGTFINGIRVENGLAISPGDQLQCGNQLIKIAASQRTTIVHCPNCSREPRLP